MAKKRKVDVYQTTRARANYRNRFGGKSSLLSLASSWNVKRPRMWYFEIFSVPFASIATKSSLMRKHTARSRHTGIWGHTRGTAPVYPAGERASEREGRSREATHAPPHTIVVQTTLARRSPAHHHFSRSAACPACVRLVALLPPFSRSSQMLTPLLSGHSLGHPGILCSFADPLSVWSLLIPRPFLPGLFHAFADLSGLSFLFFPTPYFIYSPLLFLFSSRSFHILRQSFFFFFFCHCITFSFFSLLFYSTFWPPQILHWPLLPPKKSLLLSQLLHFILSLDSFSPYHFYYLFYSPYVCCI